MNKKTKLWLASGLAAVVIVGAGAYVLADNYLGNQIEIEGVLADAPAAASSETSGNLQGSAAPSPAVSKAAGDQLNGEWTLADSSKVYFSVTTSRETVNFVNETVSGSWTLNLDDASQSSASGSIEMASVDSGNSERDNHIQEADFFNVAEYPQATFTSESFEGLPSEWTEGETYEFTMKGALGVRGMDKAVDFATKARYQGGQLLLSATTTVTFADFGMTNPHNVVLDTENDIAVQLELTLDKA